MKKFIKISSLILALLLIFGANNLFLTKVYNSKALYGSFEKKYQRAKSINDNKFIIIGGSSANLGFDTATFEALSGKPAVNLAVSGSVPLRIYMKAAENCAKSGDVIIIPLEYEFYNEEFNSINEAYVDMIAIDDDLRCEEDLLEKIEFYNTNFLRSFTRANDCALFLFKQVMKTENTIYIADSVDENGDFCLHKNRKATYKRNIVDISFEYNVDTLNAIKDFIMKMEEKGVAVYLTFPTVDKGCIKDSDKYFSDVLTVVGQYIPTENILGTPQDFAYDKDYFFDTAYHIKYDKKVEHTTKLFSVYNIATS